MTFSQSDLRRFTTCPRQYRLHTEVPPAPDPTGDRATRSLLGEAVDDAIAAMYEQGWHTQPTCVDLLRDYSYERLLARYPEGGLPESAARLHLRLAPIWAGLPETLRAEQLFAPRTYVRRDFSIEVGAHEFKGQPDLVFESDDALSIVDVKFRAKSSLRAFQLKVYQFLVEAVLRRPVTRLGYWLPRDSEVHWYRVRPVSPSFAGELASSLDQMAAGGEAPKPSGECSYCEVRDRCPEGAAHVASKVVPVAPITGSAYTGRPVITGF